MRNLLGVLGLAAMMVLSFLAAPVEAQTAATTKKISTASKYDVKDETTLSGTVTSIVTQPRTGMLLGAHLILSTATGSVDAYLGPFAFVGRNPVSVSAGESVRVVGETMKFGSSQVFVTRTVTAGSQTYTLRNQNGFPRFPSNDEPSAASVKGEPR
jgi:hypothetical protein